MSPRRRTGYGAGLIVGKCWACHAPVRATEVAKIADPSVTGTDGRPIMRLLHSARCADRFAVMVGPRIEGGDAGR